MASIYFLFSVRDEHWYIGCTSLAVEKRFARHQAGRVRSTKFRRPLVLAYYELHPDLSSARKREWFLKHLSGLREKRVITTNLLKDKLSWPRRGPFRD